jgi:hypothetical protein
MRKFIDVASNPSLFWHLFKGFIALKKVVKKDS